MDSATDIDVINDKFKNLSTTGTINKDKENYPTGGFLPIVECKSDNLINDEKDKNRKFKIKQNTLSIKDIMKKRRTTNRII